MTRIEKLKEELTEFWFNNIHYPIIVNNLKYWPKDHKVEEKLLTHVVTRADYDKLYSLLEEAISIIEFYGDRRGWEESEVKNPYDSYIIESTDRGLKAREFLKKLDGDK